MTKMTKVSEAAYLRAMTAIHEAVVQTGYCPVCGSRPGTAIKPPTKAETRKDILARDSRIEDLEESLEAAKKDLADMKADLKDGEKVLTELRNEHLRLTRAYDKENKLTGALTKKLTELEEALPKILVRLTKAKPSLPESSLKELLDMDRVGKELARS